MDIELILCTPSENVRRNSGTSNAWSSGRAQSFDLTESDDVLTIQFWNSFEANFFLLCRYYTFRGLKSLRMQIVRDLSSLNGPVLPFCLSSSRLPMLNWHGVYFEAAKRSRICGGVRAFLAHVFFTCSSKSAAVARRLMGTVAPCDVV